MQCRNMDTLKRSFSFGTSLMEVGTPTFSRGFEASPPKDKAQSPSAQQSAATTQSSSKLTVWPCESMNDELFCLEELE
ncbi:hypothetical protein ABBQ32_005643 [Trebouxia sp. C0010 RCD-2024]